MIRYRVSSTFRDRAVMDEYVAWLRGGHMEAVLRGGATEAEIIGPCHPSDPLEVETVYMFPTEDAFRSYETRWAPALRAEGRSLFPPERGVTMSRRVGRVLGAWRGSGA
ncbi:MAG: DUF4286 domain-containing protein [Phycisphaeraceae bacterium]|nr:MAG: DUF4286 domain-containing protein [Phycisphaeraceae bacterium]